MFLSQRQVLLSEHDEAAIFHLSPNYGEGEDSKFCQFTFPGLGTTEIAKRDICADQETALQNVWPINKRKWVNVSSSMTDMVLGCLKKSVNVHSVSSRSCRGVWNSLSKISRYNQQ